MMDLLKISNVSPLVQGDILYTLFGFFGPIHTFIISPSPSPSPSGGSGPAKTQPGLQVLLQYEPEPGLEPGASAADLALQLSGLALGDRSFQVARVSEAELRSQTASTSVYVGNVPPQASELSLSKYILSLLPSETSATLSSHRPISYLRLSGEPWLPARYAFVELASANLALALIACSGTHWQGGPLYMYPSMTHIDRDGLSAPNQPAPSFLSDLSQIVRLDHPLYAGLSEEEIQLKMLRLSALSGTRLATSLMGRPTSSSASTGSGHRSSRSSRRHSRSRSRSRTRSRTRSRSRSRSSRRRHHHSHSHHSGSRSNSSRYHSRKRSTSRDRT